jgi:bacterioferritin
MKGNLKVIDTLNKLLTNELSAADQYFIHARMYEDWGLNKLFERIKHESEEELEHATALVQRILFLEGVPDVVSREALNIGKNVPSMLTSDLAIEYDVGKQLKEAIALCEAEKDFQTREILKVLLKDTEEDHTYWLEMQLGLIDKVGIQNYLQSQIT